MRTGDTGTCVAHGRYSKKGSITVPSKSLPRNYLSVHPRAMLSSPCALYVQILLLTCSSQEIYVEEDRHQRAMMAMENSLMDCGSDDWSVDSDYAFQSFSDDDSAVAQTSRDARNSRSPPFRHHERHWRPRVCDTIAGDDEIPDSHGGAAENSPKFNRSPDEVSHLDVRREASTKSANEGVGMAGRVVVSDNSCSEVERDGEGLASSRDDHSKHQSGAYEARHFGDPGSSTENVQILRLEQRMFLKVIHRGLVFFVSCVFKIVLKEDTVLGDGLLPRVVSEMFTTTDFWRLIVLMHALYRPFPGVSSATALPNQLIILEISPLPSTCSERRVL